MKTSRKTANRWHTGFEQTHGGQIGSSAAWGNNTLDIVDAANRPKTGAAGSVVADRAHLVLGSNTWGLVTTGLPGTAVQYHHALYTRATMDMSGLFIPVADGKKLQLLGDNAADDGSGAFEGFEMYPERVMGPRTLPTGMFTVVGGNPCVVTTVQPHGLVTGDRIRFADNTSDTNELVANNGFWTVTVTDEVTFTVQENIGDGAGAVSDGTLEIWSRSFPTLDHEGALLCEEKIGNNTDLWLAVARLTAGERIIITKIHLAKHAANLAGSYAELVLARNLTMVAGRITAPNDGATIDHEVIARSSGQALTLDCHIEIGGNRLFTAGSSLPGANGAWILLRNNDTGGTGADAHCLIQYFIARHSLEFQPVFKFASTSNSVAILTVAAGQSFVVRHAMVDNVANTLSTMWINDNAIVDPPQAILNSASGVAQSSGHIRILGAVSGKAITLTTTGAGEARGYIDGYYEKR